MNTFSASSTTTTTGQLWAGGFCPTCGSRWLGSHACTAADLLRRAAELQQQAARLLEQARPVVTEPVDRMAHCPCRKENGGSGMCGCILGGPQITCGT